MRWKLRTKRINLKRFVRMLNLQIGFMGIKCLKRYKCE